MHKAPLPASLLLMQCELDHFADAYKLTALQYRQPQQLVMQLYIAILSLY